jgi:hypothetical protein
MSEVLGPLQRQAELGQGELQQQQHQAEETERRGREAEQAEQRKRENMLVAQGMKFIVKRQILCITPKDSRVMGTVTLMVASSSSCDDARQILVAEDEKKNDCVSPDTKEGTKQWLGTASCPAP